MNVAAEMPEDRLCEANEAGIVFEIHRSFACNA